MTAPPAHHQDTPDLLHGLLNAGLHSVRNLSVTAPTWVLSPSSALASDLTRAITSTQSSEQTFQQQQGQLVQQHYARAKLERRGLGRELYVAGTAETVTLSATSAAYSSMAGSSATVRMNRLTGSSDAHSNAAELDSGLCEAKSKLMQAGATDAMLGLRPDRAAGVQVFVLMTCCDFVEYWGR